MEISKLHGEGNLKQRYKRLHCIRRLRIRTRGEATSIINIHYELSEMTASHVPNCTLPWLIGGVPVMNRFVFINTIISPENESCLWGLLWIIS